MKTLQGNSARKPSASENEVGLVLRCVTCGTVRTFKFSQSIDRELGQRRYASLGVEADCSKCGQRLGASLTWITYSKGFTYREPPPLDGALVEDAAPLMPPTTTNGDH